MKKNRFGYLLFALISCLTITSCDFESFLSNYENVDDTNISLEQSSDSNNFKDQFGSWWNGATSNMGNWWDGASSNLGDWWDGATSNLGEWWDGTSTNIDQWWSVVSKDLDVWWDKTSNDMDIWWDNASDNLNIWWDNTKETRKELYAKADEKFQELSEYLIEEKDAAIDEVVTKLATIIYDNNKKSIGSELPKSNKTFTKRDINNINDNYNYNYDEEAFAYKLVISTIPASYQTFPAILTNENNEKIIGIGYTDLKDLYVSEDGEKFYCCGFISLNNENGLQLEDVDKGLIVTRYDLDTSYNTKFVLSYLPQEFETHCVALGKYFKFGIDENCCINYICEDYENNIVDTSLGELYSFDENKVISNNQESSIFTSSDFMKEINYNNRSISEIKKELYQLLDEYDINFKSIKIGEIFETVKSKISNYFNENNIINDIKSLTLNDICGSNIFSPVPPSESSQWEKWLIGSCCVMVCIATIVVSIYIPQLRTFMNGLAGSIVEVFVEIVIENKNVSGLDFRKIIIACVSGMVASNLNIVGDAFVGGFTEAVFSLIDNKTFDEVIQSFFYGCVAGLALGAAFNFASRAIAKVVTDLCPNFCNKVAKHISQNQVFFAKKKTFKVSGEDLVNAGYSAKSNNILDSNFNSEYSKRAMKQLPSTDNPNFKYLTLDGNISNTKIKNGYIEISDIADDSIKKSAINFETGETVHKFKVTEYQVEFDSLKSPTVKIDDMTEYRYNKIDKITGERIIGNFEKADIALANHWSKNPDAVPNMFNKYFADYNVSLDTISADDISMLRRYFDLTWHESKGGIMQLVPNALHSKIGHAGAIAGIKLSKLYSIRDVSLKGYITIYSNVLVN